MNRSTFETLLGAVVLAVGVGFLWHLANTQGIGTSGDTYPLKANFSKIDGISPGTDVRLSGIKIGNVSNLTLDPVTYMASLEIAVQNQYELPTDTVVSISSEGLLGGNYVSLSPGGAEEVLAAGDTFEYTQAPTSLTDLLGKFIFSATEEKGE